MKPLRRYDHETLRVSNRAVLFEALRREGECSRFDLAKKTGISPATVGAIVDDLIREGLLQELRVGASTGGRRPVLVDILPEGRYVMAGSLSVRGAHLTLVNLEGRIVDRRTLPGGVQGNAEVEDLVTRAVTDLLEGAALDRSCLAGCALTVPGMVRSQDGLVLHSPPLRLNQFDLPGIVTRLTGKPTAVHKDTDALLLAERARGQARERDNVVYVWVKEGVGMSYLHDGDLLVLPRGGFELGHTAWIRGGRLCHCGTPGCIGTELSELHAAALYRAETGEEVAGGYAALCARARAGEAAATRVLEAEFEVLGAVLANVVNLLNPELIVLGGPLSGAPEALRRGLEAATAARALPPFKAGIGIAFSDLPEDEVLESVGESFLGASLFPVP